MRNFNRGNSKFGGGRDFKRRDFGRRDSSDRFSMHRAICSKCGNECEVPFRPTGEKPVFCSKCFENVRHSDSRRFDGRNTDRNTDRRIDRQGEDPYKKQFEALNWKLDKLLKILTFSFSPKAPQEEKTVKKVELLKPQLKSKKKKPEVEKETNTI